MVNMIGFHHKEPTFNTSKSGESGFYIRELPRPTTEHPDRVIMSSPCTRGVIYSADHARQIIAKNNPGDFPLQARAYLENRGLSYE